MKKITIEEILHQLKNRQITKSEARSKIASIQDEPPTHPMQGSQIGKLNSIVNFDGTEDFFIDHIIKGHKVFPAAAYFELVRIGFMSLANIDADQGLEYAHTVWITPLSIENNDNRGDNKGINVSVKFSPIESKSNTPSFEFFIYTQSGDTNKFIEHANGQVQLTEKSTPEKIRLDAIQENCQRRTIKHEECYSYFTNLDITYGKSHRGVVEINIGEDKNTYRQVLSQLHRETGSPQPYLMDPGLLDSVFQSTIAYSDIIDGKPPRPSLPFCTESLTIFRAIPDRSWVWVRYSEGATPRNPIRKLDIDIVDKNGDICVQIKGYSARLLSTNKNPVQAPVSSDTTLLFSPHWQDLVQTKNEECLNSRKTIPVLLGDTSSQLSQIYPDHSNSIAIAKKPTISESYSFATQELSDLVKNLISGSNHDDTLIQIICKVSDSHAYQGLLGLLKSAEKENPIIKGQLLILEDSIDDKHLLDCISQGQRHYNIGELKFHVNNNIIYSMFKTWRENSNHKDTQPWRNNSCYVITGGNGGIAKLLAKEIASNTEHSYIYLLGRSELRPETRRIIESLQQHSVTLEYHQVDITDRDATFIFFNRIQNIHTNIDGIFHCAGVTHDRLLINKSKDSISAVLAPKVTGTINLIDASQTSLNGPMVLFASGSGVFGNAGQTDYAAANGFLDTLAQSHPHCLAIDWPLWKTGGMAATPALLNHMQAKGLSPLENSQGISALHAAISSNENQVLVLSGNAEKIRGRISSLNAIEKPLEVPEQKKYNEDDKTYRAEPTTNLIEKTEFLLRETLSKVTQLPLDRIDATSKFDKYGIDSLLVMQFTRDLEKSLGKLPKTLLFEYQTIRELSGYLIEKHERSLEIILGNTNSLNVENKKVSSTKNNKSKFTSHTETNSPTSAGNIINHRILTSEPKNANDIAIIGVSGSYAKSSNLSEYWRNLSQGIDCIEEVPSSRWDHSQYFDSDPKSAGKTYAKWGGFIEGVEEFDPLFFNISPRDAERMDPQERLFLQCVHATIEDSGYTPEGLRNNASNAGNIGIFVGVMYEEYVLYGAQEQVKGNSITLAGSPASIANRVSYSFDFNGPSMAVDTMCSSSLTTIHLACQSILNNDCSSAIAGGVNLCIHPNKFLLLGQGKFAASDGRCRSFGEGGDGYVPGEGVGALLLKPLAEAEKDGDHIYGVIKSTSINHGGATNAYTVPNPKAQSQVIKKAIEKSGINPAAIGYIEAHGTGTALGDPIEIAGLNAAFKNTGADQCAIGSTKSIIGHCESAAGVAAVSKVLLQLKHKKIAPSLHSGQTNPHIDFDDSPFQVQQSLAPWPRPEFNGKKENRVAGISSFGAGGANAHVIIEEYEGPYKSETESSLSTIIVLSAHSQSQLNQQVEQLLSYIITEEISDNDIPRIGYTLQTGRELFQQRIAFIIESRNDLEEKLNSIVHEHNDIADYYTGQSSEYNNPLANLHENAQLIDSLITSAITGNAKQLLELWVNGLHVDWTLLYREDQPQRISLPGYPFSKERYWLPTASTLKATSKNESNPPKLIHPLLHQNTSNFYEQRYSTHLSHSKKPILNEGICLEMARAAIIDASACAPNASIILKNIYWNSPLTEDSDIHISLNIDKDDDINFEIYSDSPDSKEEIINHCSGMGTISENISPTVFDIETLKSSCKKILNQLSTHSDFENDVHKLQDLLVNQEINPDQALAKVEVSHSDLDQIADYTLPPSLIASIMKTCTSLNASQQLSSNESTPIAIEQLEIFSSVPATAWIWVQRHYPNQHGSNPVTIHIMDKSGLECLAIQGLIKNEETPSNENNFEPMRRASNE